MMDFFLSMFLGKVSSMFSGLGGPGMVSVVVGGILLVSLTAVARRFFCTPKGMLVLGRFCSSPCR